MNKLLIVFVLISFAAGAQTQPASMVSDSARFSVFEPRRYWSDSQGRQWNTFYLTMDSLRAWGERQGWGTGGGADSSIYSTHTYTDSAIASNVASLQDSIDDKVSYSDSITVYTTPSQLKDSIDTKQDELTGNGYVKNTISGISYVTSIPNSDLQNSTISGHGLGNDLSTLTLGSGLTGTSYNGTGAVTAKVDTSLLATLTALNDSITANSIDTTSLSNRINLKVSIADTSSMLSPYLRKADTLSLSNRINTKLTATDTASLSNRINLKVNIADTAAMLANYYNTGDTIPVSRGGTGSASDSIARLSLGVSTTTDAATLLGAKTFKTETLGRSFTDITGTGTVSSGLLIYIALKQVPSGTVLTGANIYIGAGLSGTVLSSGNCRIGLATYSGGTYTMVDSTANDSTLFKGTISGYTGANFVTPYTTSGETSLFAAIIYKTGGTSTTFTIGTTPAVTNSAVLTGLFTNSAKVYATLSGQSYLPSSQAASGLTAQQSMAWIGIY
jgi:hypothetical protein